MDDKDKQAELVVFNNDAAWDLAQKVRTDLDRKSCPGAFMDLAMESINRHYPERAAKFAQSEAAAFIRKGGTVGWNIDYSKLPYGTQFYTQPAPAVSQVSDDLRQAALIDLAYINGAKAGWNMCVADDESQFKKLTEGVVECVKVLKNTRSHQTAQPVQPASKGRICSCIECVPDEPPESSASINKQLLKALEISRNYVEAVYLNTPNPKKARNYSQCLDIIDAALKSAKEHGL